MGKRDLLRLDRLSAETIDRVTERATVLAHELAAGADACAATLAGRRLALIVEDRGWRNPAALELGAKLLGAHCVTVPVSLSGREPIDDLGRYLSNWFDLVAVRTPSFADLEALALACACPVMNLRTRENHPCETLGDLSFIRTRRPGAAPLHVVAIAPAANILHSWAELACVYPIELTQLYPRAYWIDRASYRGARIQCTESRLALGRADVLVTDCWPEVSADGAGGGALDRFRVTAAMLDRLPAHALFIPCPPVTRGQEVSADAMTHQRCVGFEAKAYLLHAQIAYVEHALGVEESRG